MRCCGGPGPCYGRAPPDRSAGGLKHPAGLAWRAGLALLGLYGPAPVRALVRAYVDVFRALPVLVLSFWSITRCPLWAFPSVPLPPRPWRWRPCPAPTPRRSYAPASKPYQRGSEAGRVLGLSFPQILRLIVCPGLPSGDSAPTGTSINVLKDTALASVVAAGPVDRRPRLRPSRPTPRPLLLLRGCIC